MSTIVKRLLNGVEFTQEDDGVLVAHRGPWTLHLLCGQETGIWFAEVTRDYSIVWQSADYWTEHEALAATLDRGWWER